MSRPLFKLEPRLLLCAELMSPSLPLWDVGTDHGYLPIWLIKSGRLNEAYASDLRESPLLSAKKNALRYGVAEKIKFFKAEGLSGFHPQEPMNIVIAGMGGETILSILRGAPDLAEFPHHLVLGPMSSADSLRRGLSSLGLYIIREQAVLDNGRPYCAFSAEFGRDPLPTTSSYPYMGRLSPENADSRAYAGKVLRDLSGRLKGAVRGRGEEDEKELRAAILEIKQRWQI